MRQMPSTSHGGDSKLNTRGKEKKVVGPCEMKTLPFKHKYIRITLR